MVLGLYKALKIEPSEQSFRRFDRIWARFKAVFEGPLSRPVKEIDALSRKKIQRPRRTMSERCPQMQYILKAVTRLFGVVIMPEESYFNVFEERDRLRDRVAHLEDENGQLRRFISLNSRIESAYAASVDEKIWRN